MAEEWTIYVHYLKPGDLDFGEPMEYRVKKDANVSHLRDEIAKNPGHLAVESVNNLYMRHAEHGWISLVDAEVIETCLQCDKMTVFINVVSL
jgi:hypothetical protein